MSDLPRRVEVRKVNCNHPAPVWCIYCRQCARVWLDGDHANSVAWADRHARNAHPQEAPC